MPVIFAQPSPLGSAADIGVGAGMAETMTKDLPTLASLYENAARLRFSQAGGGGGGHGGSGSSGGYVQTLPGGDGGGGYEEAQANRDQQAQAWQFAATHDPVAQHIQQQEQFKLQQQLSAQRAQAQELAAMNGRGGAQQTGGEEQQQPPPAPWTRADDEAMNNATQALDTIQDEYNAGRISVETRDALSGPKQQQQADLNGKQQQWSDFQDQQAYQKAVKSQALKNSLIDTEMGHGAANSPRQVPDLPAPIYGYDKNGKMYMKNEVVYKGAEAARLSAQNHNQQLQLALAAQEDNRVKARAAADQAEEKNVTADRSQAHHEITTEYKGKVDSSGKPVLPPEGAVEARAKELGTARADAREERGLQRNSNPQAVAGYMQHLDSMPQSNGSPDFNKATNSQLAQLGKFLSDPKAIGVTRKEAAAGRAKITKILQDKADALTRPATAVTPPPPKESQVFNDTGTFPPSGQRAAERQRRVGAAVGRGLETIGGQLSEGAGMGSLGGP